MYRIRLNCSGVYVWFVGLTYKANGRHEVNWGDEEERSAAFDGRKEAMEILKMESCPSGIFFHDAEVVAVEMIEG